MIRAILCLLALLLVGSPVAAAPLPPLGANLSFRFAVLGCDTLDGARAAALARAGDDREAVRPLLVSRDGAEPTCVFGPYRNVTVVGFPETRTVVVGMVVWEVHITEVRTAMGIPCYLLLPFRAENKAQASATPVGGHVYAPQRQVFRSGETRPAPLHYASAGPLPSVL